MIRWPIAADHFYISKLLEEEVKVCVELARGNKNGIRHEDVVRVIDLVMDDESKKGVEMRCKACQVKEMVKNAIRDEQGFKGSSAKGLEEFLATALLRKKVKMDRHHN
ncbi:hypothetical protein C5167_000770 [Papaver somniferum]|uniref:Uncharacterized protein n=1 Tax=Papaver somniferum TaxID=3469 RepID=A0A4Y7KTE8_PAPSO|nr:hypothetical protein C5167_000770 [Papaver somniferum]